MEPFAIKTEQLTKTYPGSSRPAVDGLNLAVPRGRVLGFLGPNGAGKTTSIKMICGLVKPDAGDVWLNGYHAARQRREAMHQFGVVLEGTRNVYWRLSAWQNLVFFARLKGWSESEVRAVAQRLLRELDLWEQRHQPLRQFSRGMQQKVAIACALIGDPPIVLLDEPTLGLDVQAARTVKSWITRLARDRNKTVLLTTHQLDVAQQVCDHVAIIREGQIIANHPTEELLALFEQQVTTLRVSGTLDQRLERWASGHGLTVQATNGSTILSGRLDEANHLHQLLETLHRQGHSLEFFDRAQLSLEEIFVELIDQREVSA